MALGSAATREAICATLVSGPASETAIAYAIGLEFSHPEIVRSILHTLRTSGLLAREGLLWRLTTQVVVTQSTVALVTRREEENDPREQKCSRCATVKPAREFYVAKRFGGLSSYCRGCMRAYQQARRATRQRAQAEGKKFCPKCCVLKNLEDFGPRAASKDRRQGYCRPCNANQRAIINAPPRGP